MASLESNQQQWDGTYDWTQAGEEWSASWGNSQLEWSVTLFPRIRAFVPTGTILEIAPGYGRWTQYLKNYCDRLIAVDLSARCIDACRIRFADATHIEYHVNDGKSLAMVPDHSVDFAFSFDSLVHADPEALDAYLQELSRKLTPNGVGFFHHSNIGSYARSLSLSKRLPYRVSAFLFERGLLARNEHWRAERVTAASFASMCEQNGLRCMTQEIITWGQEYLIDCLSTFTTKASAWNVQNRTIVNRTFMNEADLAARLFSHYRFPKVANEDLSKTATGAVQTV
jgi:SAM-dependent methyltransferase